LESHARKQSNIVVDLGSGTGSSVRALSALGAFNLFWRLVDNDSGLLGEAIRRHGKMWVIEDYQADLNIIDELPLDGTHLVTASALFDLVSREFVEELVERLSKQNSGLYAALNYDGTTEWTPVHPLDEIVLQAFNQDQRRDKGFGPALGPEAAVYLETIFRSAGYVVFVAYSPWQLSSADNFLVNELIQGIANAVSEYIDKAELSAWKEFRLANAFDGTCKVGHLDILALPEKS
jgi:hypothetical protein